MSIVTLEHLHLRMEREFFTRAMADLAAAETRLNHGAPPGPLPEWPGLPAASAELRRRHTCGEARMGAALRRDRAALLRRLAAFKARFGAAEPWVTGVAARLAGPLGAAAATGQPELDPAHA